jgi:hypothetical protein
LCPGWTSDELFSAWTETQSCGSLFFGLVVLVGDGVGVGVLVGDGVFVGDLLGEGDVLVGDGLGLVEAGTVGEVVGLVDLLLLELLLGLGVALPELLVLLLGRALDDVLSLCVGSALDEAVMVGLVVVGSVVVVRLADGSTLAEADLRGVVVPVGELLVAEALELGVVLVLAESLALPVIGRSGLAAAWLTLRCRPLYSPRCLPTCC